jgi:hypothetical protein
MDVAYRPAQLTSAALAAVQRLERELGVVLVAYRAEPAAPPRPQPAPQPPRH